MIKAEIDDMLSTLLAENSVNFYTKDNRELAIQNACKYINSEAGLLRTVAQIPVLPTDPFIPMPSDFQAHGQGADWQQAGTDTTVSLEYQAVMQIRQRDANWTATRGFPSALTSEGGRLYLYPWPSVGGTLLLSYVAAPNIMAEPDDVPFYGDPRIDAYHDTICWYAAWYLLFKDRDFEAGDRCLRAFRERFVDLKESLRRTPDRPHQVVWSDPYKE